MVRGERLVDPVLGGLAGEAASLQIGGTLVGGDDESLVPGIVDTGAGVPADRH